MWDGRFKKSLDSKVNDFNSSIKFDWVMFREDITGSIAHAYMLGETGIIEKCEAEKSGTKKRNQSRWEELS
jgi:argininosuccinate lyase